MTRWLLRLLVLIGLAVVAWKLWQLLQEDEDHSQEWAAAARQPAEQAAQAEEANELWVKPIGSGCPPGYPVKAKTASRVFRVPGMFSYEESKPERCYCDEAAATADGFTRAKR